MDPKRIAILGSTGSIGRQAMDVAAASDALRPCALGARSNWELLAAQAKAFRPDAVALSETGSADALAKALPDGVDLLTGPDAMDELIRRTRPDVVLNGVVGTAGVAPTMTAIEVGARLAIANKETIVCAGSTILPAARAAGVDILPVDSEHSGVFQCLLAGRRDDVRRVTLTASGGALRDWSDADAAEATAAEALAHPTWDMGPKVTVDSATMMNKALEVIEAHWLFDLPAAQIDVLLHPQSVVHAMVEFRDGTVIAQLASPDMKLPIAYALTFPERLADCGTPLDLAEIGSLDFRPLTGRFARAVNLAKEVIQRGGTSGAILNAANESAVQAFLAGRIRFGDILDLVENVLRRPTGPDEGAPSLADLMSADAWARRQVAERLDEMPAPTTQQDVSF